MLGINHLVEKAFMTMQKQKPFYLTEKYTQHNWKKSRSRQGLSFTDGVLALLHVNPSVVLLAVVFSFEAVCARTPASPILTIE